MMKIKDKKKLNLRTYTFMKDDADYLLTDGQYSFKSPNIDFIKSFAERVRASGHVVNIDQSVLHELTCNRAYDDPAADCGGCVCNTGEGCLLQKEGA